MANKKLPAPYNISPPPALIGTVETLSEFDIETAVEGLFYGQPVEAVARRIGATIEQIIDSQEVFNRWYDKVVTYAQGYVQEAARGSFAAGAMQSSMKYICGWYQGRLDAMKPSPTYIGVVISAQPQMKVSQAIVDRPRSMTMIEWLEQKGALDALVNKKARLLAEKGEGC